MKKTDGGLKQHPEKAADGFFTCRGWVAKLGSASVDVLRQIHIQDNTTCEQNYPELSWSKFKTIYSRAAKLILGTAKLGGFLKQCPIVEAKQPSLETVEGAQASDMVAGVIELPSPMGTCS